MTTTKILTVLGTAFAALAMATSAPASAHDVGDNVTLTFQEAIPNIPGKSLTAFVVDYPPVGNRLRMSMENRLSSTPTSFPEKSSRR